MLYSGILILIGLGVYIFVNTFHRFEKRQNMLSAWSQKHPLGAKIISNLMLLSALIGLILWHGGFWTSFFMWLNGLILMLMLIILLNPINRIKMTHVYLVMAVLIIFEMLLTYAS